MHDLKDEAKLVQFYAPTVRKIAGHIARRANYQVETEDLESEGMIGLIEAARGFDPARGVKFNTYADHRIKGRMLDSVRANDWVPRLVRSRSREGQRARDARYKATGERTEQAVDTHRISGTNQRRDSDWCDPARIVPRHRKAGKDRETDLIGSVRSREQPPYVKAEQADAVWNLTKHMSRSDRFVVLSSAVHGLSMAEVGKALGVSESMSFRVRKQALASLRARWDGTIQAMSP